eukprot:295052-Amphidinium_carterae.2
MARQFQPELLLQSLHCACCVEEDDTVMRCLHGIRLQKDTFASMCFHSLHIMSSEGSKLKAKNQ